MAHSESSGNRWFAEKIKELSPKRVLDVGTGAGKFYDICKSVDPEIIIDGIEAWEPYVYEFNLKDRYNNFFLKDAREHTDFNYDLVIFGDVIEHMSEEDALALWDKAVSGAKNVLLQIPTVHYPQHVEEGGNPYQEHVVDDWSVDRVMLFFSHIYDFKVFQGSTSGFLASKNV